MKHGCSLYDATHPISVPMSFWTQQDVLRYIKENELKYASVYGDIIEKEGKLILTGEQRTGCIFCCFGVHRDGTPNRFQRMKQTHPHLYTYCLEKLKLNEVLDFIKIPYD